MIQKIKNILPKDNILKLILGAIVFYLCLPILSAIYRLIKKLTATAKSVFDPLLDGMSSNQVNAVINGYDVVDSNLNGGMSIIGFGWVTRDNEAICNAIDNLEFLNVLKKFEQYYNRESGKNLRNQLNDKFYASDWNKMKLMFADYLKKD